MNILLVFLGLHLFHCLAQLNDGTAVELIDKNGQLVEAYHGVVYELTGQILLSPKLRARVVSAASFTGNVCGFKLHKDADGSSMPFLVKPISFPGGYVETELVVPPETPLIYGHDQDYHFQVSAYDCDNPAHTSNRIAVVLRVEPYETPSFERNVYNAVLSSKASVGTRVLKVSAHETFYEQRHHVINSVCKYAIEAPLNSPFDIDGNGVIRTRALISMDKTAEKHFVLRIVAKDCMIPTPREGRVSVNIRVIRDCQLGWKGVQDVVEHSSSSSKANYFAENVAFEWCEVSCRQTRVSTTVTLSNSETSLNAEYGCDRNARSICRQRQQCGAHADTVDLLATLNYRITPLINSNVDAADKCASIPDVDESITFDGVSTAVDIPSEVFPRDHILGSKFTVTFWMKHKRPMHHAKEQILCNADGSKMNRHHYSIFLHNCKIIVLLRKEFDAAAMNKFVPSEWRFKLNQACDNHWHHYAISHDQDSMKLYLDGQLFVSSASNPEIVDDWPMHRSTIKNTRLTVGACWHAGQGKLVQFFTGKLAALSILRNHEESDEVLSCLNKCQEQLEFSAMNKMAPGMSVSFNADLSMLVISGSNTSEVSKLLREVGYINTKVAPAPGQRSLALRTEIRCENDKMSVEVPEVKTKVLVRPSHKAPLLKVGVAVKTAEPPKIVNPVVSYLREDPEKKKNRVAPATESGAEPLVDITSVKVKLFGSETLRHDQRSLVHPGIRLFPDLRIQVNPQSLRTQTAENVAKNLFLSHAAAGVSRDVADAKASLAAAKATGGKLVDSCVVRTNPSLTGVEQILWPEKVAQTEGIRGLITEKGLVMEGVAARHVYEQLLRQVRYINEKVIIIQRQFVLSCSIASATYVSNELVVKVLMAPELAHHLPVALSGVTGENEAKGVVHEVKANPAFAFESEHSRSNLAVSRAVAQVNSSTIVIAVVCTVFLLLLLVVGFLRLRQARRRPAAAAEYINNDCNNNADNLNSTGPLSKFRRIRQLASSKKALAATHLDGAVCAEEMEWDNTALNITVNPLENEHFSGLSGDTYLDADDLSTDAEDVIGGSCCSEEEDDDEEDMHLVLVGAHKNVAAAVPSAQSGAPLEWDDSTLPPAPMSSQQQQQLQHQSSGSLVGSMRSSRNLVV